MYYCPLRNQPVPALPEEEVRLSLLNQMMEKWGYPKSHIVLEKSLHLLPHLVHSTVPIPDCRIDILVYGKNLQPLLMIECKAVELNEEVIRQAVGYNYYCQAPFVALANQTSIKTGWLKEGVMQWIDFLPPYENLEKAIS